MSAGANATNELIGWIGLGAIGAPMAQRVAQAGWPLQVWNRDRAKAEALAMQGASVATTPAALAREAGIVCLCVTDAAAVEQVVFGPEGAAAGLAPGGIVIDHSTIAPDATRAFAARLLAERGGHWIDAPVSGGPAGAREGRLTVFAGGDAAALARVQPLLQAYAARITHLGAAGSGQIGKACNQLVSFGTAAVLAEALHLAQRQGLDAAALVQAMQAGFADSAVLRHYAGAMLAGVYSGSTLNALKDTEIALALGREATAPLPMAELLATLYRQLVAQGHTRLGMAGVMRLYVEGPLADVPALDRQLP
ncbi:MAG: NAD(P)-dependent oxidoreductase [Proteobacteria bacterium]|nr:NAD(P)-dependent oxidoreductase [Pseudomonadota bacterium]